MTKVFYIFIGGGIGASLRYLVSLIILSKSISYFFLPTLFVNIIGSFLIGIVYALYFSPQVTNVYLFLVAGVLGGFTTYSAFSLEVLKLIQDKNYHLVIAYLFFSLIGGVAAVFLGYTLAKIGN